MLKFLFNKVAGLPFFFKYSLLGFDGNDLNLKLLMFTFSCVTPMPGKSLVPSLLPKIFTVNQSACCTGKDTWIPILDGRDQIRSGMPKFRGLVIRE